MEQSKTCINGSAGFSFSRKFDCMEERLEDWLMMASVHVENAIKKHLVWVKIRVVRFFV